MMHVQWFFFSLQCRENVPISCEENRYTLKDVKVQICIVTAWRKKSLTHFYSPRPQIKCHREQSSLQANVSLIFSLSFVPFTKVVQKESVKDGLKENVTKVFCVFLFKTETYFSWIIAWKRHALCRRKLLQRHKKHGFLAFLFERLKINYWHGHTHICKCLCVSI